jgi:hypothetical protein
VCTRKKLSPSFAILVMCIGCADNTPTMTPDSRAFDAMPDSGTNRPDTAARSSDSGGQDVIIPDAESHSAADAASVSDGRIQADDQGLSQRSTVTFTTFIDETCTQLPPRNSVVVLDLERPCNDTPKGSISNVICLADGITYTNHPNVDECASGGIFNELPIGVCLEFPGPVRTWKYIVPETYFCRSPEP